MLRVRFPLVPRMVNVYVPVGVERLVRSESVDDRGAGFCLSVAVAPRGSLLTLRRTEPAKPPDRAIATV